MSRNTTTETTVDSYDFSYDPTTSRNRYFREKIEKISRDMTVAPSFYKEVLRSLLADLQLYYVDSQGKKTDVKLHHGRQERVIAKKFQENNIVLPYSTVFQAAVIDDTEKRRSRSVLQFSKRWNEETQRAERVVSYPDIPIKVQYTYSLWCKYVSDIDQLSEQLRIKFNPHKHLNIKDTAVLKSYLVDETDISITAVGDKEDRLVQKNFNIEVQGYLPSPKFLITNSGRITEINSEFVIVNC